VTPARHLAATAVTTAGSATPDVRKPTARLRDQRRHQQRGQRLPERHDNATLTSTVAGATLQAGQVITLRMPYVCD
jgi:hypothetical protein